MKSILLILLPIILLSYFLAGGFNSPFPQKTVIPSGAPRLITDDDTANSAGKQLQLNTLKFKSPSPQASPSIAPSPLASITPSQPPVTCVSDTNRASQPGCQCPSYPQYNTIGVLCQNGTVVPPYLFRIPSPTNTYPARPVTLACPGGGVPCSYFNVDAVGQQLQASLGCQLNSCIYLKEASPNGFWSANPNYPTYEAQCGNNSICYAKPVIYLYPETDILVDVKLEIPGRVTISDPTYPEAGWQNVLAHPGGSLEYQNNVYKELFYESEVTQTNKPKNGLVIAKLELYSKLDESLYKLGLKYSERQEFLEFWVPRLTDLPGDYILFSLIDPVEKERVDKVKISPEPETRIEILAYFKPLYLPIVIPPLVLPEKPPARTGFTMVEWGGTIDN